MIVSAENTVAVDQWSDRGDSVGFILITNNKTGRGWLRHFKQRNILIGNHTKRALCSEDFMPTCSMRLEIEVLKGSMFLDNRRTLIHMGREAKKRGLCAADPEVACLIRDAFTDAMILRMGVRFIVVGHQPIAIPIFGDVLLGAGDVGEKSGCWLGMVEYMPSTPFFAQDGIAFVKSCVKSH